jgi:hypothetical protein
MKKKIVKQLTDQQLEVIWFALSVKDDEGNRYSTLKVPTEKKRSHHNSVVDFRIWNAVNTELRKRGAGYVDVNELA